MSLQLSGAAEQVEEGRWASGSTAELLPQSSRFKKDMVGELFYMNDVVITVRGNGKCEHLMRCLQA